MTDSEDSTSRTPVAIRASEQWESSSPDDGYRYRILLAHPDGPEPAEGHPSIYVLDGDAMFATVVEAVRMRARRPDVTGVVPTVVVGIASAGNDPYDRRRRHYDYTPGSPSGSTSGIENPVGGATTFLDFLTSTVAPEVSVRVTVDPRRQTIFGHSLAGLFVLEAIGAASPFSCFAAASPSIWWDPARLLEKARALRSTDSGNALPRVLITAGEYEERLAPREIGKPASEEIQRRRAERRMVTGAGEIASALAASGATVHFESFPGEDHASSVLLAVNRLLPFALAHLDPTP